MSYFDVSELLVELTCTYFTVFFPLLSVDPTPVACSQPTGRLTNPELLCWMPPARSEAAILQRHSSPASGSCFSLVPRTSPPSCPMAAELLHNAVPAQSQVLLASLSRGWSLLSLTEPVHSTQAPLHKKDLPPPPITVNFS